jgi:pyruvate dehydrogenase E1 component beta subunit
MDEGWSTYGITVEVSSRIQHACFDDLDAPVERVGLVELPMPYAKSLERAALTHDAKIEAAAMATCDLRPRRDWLAGERR